MLQGPRAGALEGVRRYNRSKCKAVLWVGVQSGFMGRGAKRLYGSGCKAALWVRVQSGFAPHPKINITALVEQSTREAPPCPLSR